MRKKIISSLLSIAMILTMGITVAADDTTTSETTAGVTAPAFAKPEDVASDAAQGTLLDENGNPIETEAPTTTYVTVTDADGNPVTDADGNPVTEVSVVGEGGGEGGDSEEGEVTTVPQEMEGQFETRSLSNEDLANLDKIKKELEAEKKNSFGNTFGFLTALAGIIVILYSFVVLLAFLIDKVSLAGDFECLRLVTFNNAVTLRDENDREQMKANSEKTKVTGVKEIAVNTIIGLVLGTLLTQSTNLISIVQAIYNTITG